MRSIWIINQYANSSDMPGHTRQYEISKYLVKNGWKVSLFSSDFNLSERKFYKLKKFNLYLKEKIDGINWNWIKVIPYKKNNWKRYFNMISFCVQLFFLLTSKCFSKIIKRELPDIILASSPQLPAAYVSLIIAKFFKIPFILEIRDLWPQVLIDQGGKSERNLIVIIFRFMERYLYKNSTSLIILAKGAKEYVHKRGGRDIHFLPNGPDIDLFKYSLPAEKKSFSTKNPFRIIYAGAHGEANDLENVIKASKYLMPYPIEIILIGDGINKKKLINLAVNCPNVKFKDPLPKSSMPIFLSKGDSILVSLKDVPLFKYGVSPNKLYDAYAIGRPVIVTVSGHIKEEVEKYNLGVFASPGKPRELAQQIINLYSKSSSERKIMGRNGREIAEKIYSRKNINVNFKKIIDAI